jgi:hypothetical protein
MSSKENDCPNRGNGTHFPIPEAPIWRVEAESNQRSVLRVGKRAACQQFHNTPGISMLVRKVGSSPWIGLPITVPAKSALKVRA